MITFIIGLLLMTVAILLIVTIATRERYYSIRLGYIVIGIAVAYIGYCVMEYGLLN